MDQILDGLALRACHKENLGNEGNWFLSFRGGLYGVRSRIHGARYHSALLHGRIPRPAIPTAEHHISVILFCMDSAIECFVFMLNALGQAAEPEGFRSVRSARDLRSVGPRDILEDECEGYQSLYPRVRACWHDRGRVLRLIMENHDVAKHRTQTSQAGSFSIESLPDPPNEGARPEKVAAFAASLRAAPMEEVLLPRDPKLPVEERSSDLADWTTLEELEAEWETLISDSFQYAALDVRNWD